MSKMADNTNGKIIVEYDPERIDALNMQLGESNKTVEGELGSALDALYNRTVNPKLKQFIAYKKKLAEMTEAKA